jgi:Zn finger protein HypA/HybF involved in hydrogenase expression
VKLKTASAGCSGTTTVTCNIGSLASGATTALTITVQAIASGTVTNTASVSLNETDGNAADNTASASTTITPHHP